MRQPCTYCCIDHFAYSGLSGSTCQPEAMRVTIDCRNMRIRDLEFEVSRLQTENGNLKQLTALAEARLPGTIHQRRTQFELAAVVGLLASGNMRNHEDLARAAESVVKCFCREEGA